MKTIKEMAMKMPIDLGPNLIVKLEHISGKGFEVILEEYNENGKLIDELGTLFTKMITDLKNGCPVGTYEVFHSDSISGYGPLLYDIAIEWATVTGEGLMSDRESVSADAANVWEKYYNDRVDVIKIPLPENCKDPKSGYKRYGQPVESTWSKNRFLKEDLTIISQLSNLGKIKIKVDLKDIDLSNLRKTK
jgi:hypothetical protein